ncbi:MAG: hypothetical protein EXQ47_04740 [Bryobacterales bacterium]|nr:hypothetical protein [Bryobacterales bacterium]
MTARLLVLALLLPLALQAQVVLMSLNGIKETPVGTGYTYGEVAAGDAVDVRFHARNQSSGSMTITNLKVTGAGFSIVNTSSTPFVVAPGGVMAVFVRFLMTQTGDYSGTLQVTWKDAAGQSSSVTASLQATAVPAPVVTVAAPCTGPDTTKTISFGRSQQFTKVSCTLTIQNPGSQPFPVTLGASIPNSGFSAGNGNSAAVAGGQTGTFVYTFNAPAALVYTAPLTVGPRTYTLYGVGYSAALPEPVWTFDRPTFSSGEQHTLSVALAGPAPVAAFGNLRLTFTSAASSITDDSAIQFVATSKRIASFTVKAGETAVLINCQPNTIFATGTTAGRITLTLEPGAFGITGDPSTSINIAPASISIAASSATRVANNLQVVVTGFDNTYTIGPMSFTFYDRAGGVIASAMQSDLSSSFRSFYQGKLLGSSFLVRITFPVTGDATSVGGMEAALDNSAGSVRTQRITFP